MPGGFLTPSFYFQILGLFPSLLRCWGLEDVSSLVFWSRTASYFSLGPWFSGNIFGCHNSGGGTTNWLASYNAQAAPTKNYVAPNFHCTEVENSWSAMEIRKWPISEVSLIISGAGLPELELESKKIMCMYLAPTVLNVYHWELARHLAFNSRCSINMLNEEMCFVYMCILYIYCSFIQWIMI